MLPTPRSKSKKRINDALPRAYVVFWRAFPNKELFPVDPEGRHKFIYDLEQPGIGLGTLTYYLRKGYRIVDYKIDMPQNKMGPIIEELLPQIEESVRMNRADYDDAAREFRPEMIANIVDEKEQERRDNMNALLRAQAGKERKRQIAKEGKGGTLAEAAGVL